MPKHSRHPIAYNDLLVGQWYESRFAFRDAERNTESSTTTTTAATIVAPSAGATSDTRAQPRNKSHRVFVLAKYPDPATTSNTSTSGHAICLFLTTFGGRLDDSTSICCSQGRLNYLPVNSTKSLVSVYKSLPISVKALYGYLNFTSEYTLPVGGGTEAIVRIKVARNSGASITSPDWVIAYIRRLKEAWVKLLWAGEIQEKWLEQAEEVGAEFPETGGASHVAVVAEVGASDGKRRFRAEEGDDDAKRQRRSDSVDDVSNDFDGNDTLDDSGIHDMYGEDQGGQEEEERYRPFDRASPPYLINVDFYEPEMDEHGNGLDDYVDFPLLDALFRPFPF